MFNFMNTACELLSGSFGEHVHALIIVLVLDLIIIFLKKAHRKRGTDPAIPMYYIELENCDCTKKSRKFKIAKSYRSFISRKWKKLEVRQVESWKLRKLTK